MIDDDAAAEELVRKNISWMIAVSEKLLGDHSLAEDAVQEAFLAAFRGLEKFVDRSSLKTWWHRITVNASLMKLRQLKRQPVLPLNDTSRSSIVTIVELKVAGHTSQVLKRSFQMMSCALKFIRR